MGQNSQIELKVEIYSNSLVKMVGKNITHEIHLEHPLNPITVMENGPCL